MKQDKQEIRPRFRDLGYTVGDLEIGKLNSITDVPGVKVGHCTIIEGNSRLIPGKGPVRTGVTVILPHEKNVYREKVRAGYFVLNGYGKTTGLVQVQELGCIESYIGLTNTLSIPAVTDALIDFHIEENPDVGISTSSINVVVGECNDGFLNDMQGRHVKKEHVFHAIENASRNVEEGCVGAGTGMSLFGYKGGIGTASRVVIEKTAEYVVGVLVLTNFGHRKDLTILGKKLHKEGMKQVTKTQHHGSVMVIIATDAPLNNRQLTRLAKRAPLGLARTGSFASWDSGDIIITFSTTNRIRHDENAATINMSIINESTKLFSSFLKAVVEATEEAVLNSLCKATSMTGRDDNYVEAISIEKIKELLES